ncbi:MAG: hypothetical protein HLUCCO16_07280 [Phormidium sp. OSCR]|nr:MAG: hypothetical protein HLUCCO16_07280 [Phormidium sp. OSCR]
MDYLKAAHYFVIKAYEDGVEADITNMKVQKLLYYAQSLHLALYDEPLFDEPIQRQDMKELGLQKLDLIERDNPTYEGVMSEVVSQGLAENSSTRISQGEVHDWLTTLLD